MRDSESHLVAQTFVRFHEVMEEKLRRGSISRQALRSSLNRGEEPHGPRAEWIRAAAAQVLEVLGSQARDFNTKYVDDRISVADMADVLATVLNLLARK